MPVSAPNLSAASGTNRLRTSDATALLRLVSEAYEAEADASRRQEHVLAGLCDLIGAVSASSVKLRNFLPGGQRRMVLSASHDTKVYDAESRDALHRRMRQPDLVDPFELLGRRGVADAGQSAVWRAGHLSDHEWYNSVYYNEFARHLRLDDRIQITRQIGDRGLVHSVSFCRATGDPKFDERALQLGSLAIDSMSLLRKWSISSGTVFDAARRAGAVAEETRAIDTDGVELTPKLKEVLELLLQGDSEKQIALKLKRSIHTVHTHVKRLHKAYDVSSRGELFARFLKR